MKKLFVNISDVHLKLSTIEVSIKVMKQSLDKARELGLPFFINGDLNDTKAILRSECVRAIIGLFKEYSDIPISINVGNHDLENKNSEGNSLEFLDILPNVNVIYRETIVTFNDTKFGVIPYKKTNQEFLDAADLFRQGGIQYLLTHQGFLGSFMGDYVIDESSINPQLVSDFKRIISGHYHKAQNVAANITYTGSPYTVNFGEAGQDKFFWVVSEDDNEIIMEAVNTDVRKHEVIEFDGKIPRQVPKFRDDTILKVILKGSKEFCAKTKREKVQKKVGLESVVIATDITSQSKIRLDTKDIHSPEKVIETYLNSCETDFDKTELLNLLKSVAKDSFENMVSNNKRNFKISSVHCENFLSFKELDFEYENNGLTLVNGWDVDREIFTGAGKSTFMDAPYYALFGKTSKNLKADEVVNREAKKDCLVIVKLDSDEGVYTIKRYRKHSELKNDLLIIGPDGDEIRGKDNNETQKFIDSLLGVTPEIFLNATYFTQFNVIDKFLSSSDTEKKKLIAEISNTQIYDNIENDIKNNIKDLKVSIADHNISLERANARLEEAQKTEISLKTSYDDESERIEWSKGDLKARMDNFTNDKVKALHKLEDESLNYIQQRKARLEHAKKNLEDDKKNYDINLKTTTKRNQENLETLRSSEASIKSKIELLEATTQRDFSIDSKRLDDRLENVNKLKQLMALKNQDVYSKSNSINTLKSDIDIESDKINNDECMCSLCHQTINTSILQNIIDDKRLQIESLDSEVKVLVDDIDKIKKALSVEPQLMEELEKLSIMKFEQNSIVGQVKDQETLLDQTKLQIEGILNICHVDFHSRYELEIEKIEDELNPYQSQIEQVKGATNIYISQYESAMIAVNPFEAQVKAACDNIALYIGEVNALDVRTAEYVDFMARLEFWKDALKVYIKSYLVDSFIEQINTMANHYLESISDGLLKVNISSTTASGKEIKEKIDVTILNGSNSCSYQSLSGGERTRICLALNLSLSDAITNTSGKSFRILMLDEVFDGLDEVGKSHAMMLLKGLEVNYDTIFVIDHATEFKSLFNNSVLIEKKSDISKLAI